MFNRGQDFGLNIKFLTLQLAWIYGSILGNTGTVRGNILLVVSIVDLIHRGPVAEILVGGGGGAPPPHLHGKLTNFRKFWPKRGLKTVFSSANRGVRRKFESFVGNLGGFAPQPEKVYFRYCRGLEVHDYMPQLFQLFKDTHPHFYMWVITNPLWWTYWTLQKNVMVLSMGHLATWIILTNPLIQYE
jgi:hypothetical protein